MTEPYPKDVAEPCYLIHMDKRSFLPESSMMDIEKSAARVRELLGGVDGVTGLEIDSFFFMDITLLLPINKFTEEQAIDLANRIYPHLPVQSSTWWANAYKHKLYVYGPCTQVSGGERIHAI
jgi:hypothetical protein